MTEAAWNSCTDPQRMLEFLGPRITERKGRLFAVACCKGIWHRMGDTLRGVVDVGEQYADDIHADANTAAEVASEEGGEDNPFSMAAWNTVALSSETGDPIWIATGTANQVNLVEDCTPIQCRLARCVFGSLAFRSTILAPQWRTAPVTALAEAIYTDRAFDRLPILADALEDAGCTDPAILAHCRGPGPHARGCWVVDLLLGKS